MDVNMRVRDTQGNATQLRYMEEWSNSSKRSQYRQLHAPASLPRGERDPGWYRLRSVSQSLSGRHVDEKLSLCLG
jgi:hypothetical protein